MAFYRRTEQVKESQQQSRPFFARSREQLSE